MTRSLQAAISIVLAASSATAVFGSVVKRNLETRQDPQNIVYVTDANTFW